MGAAWDSFGGRCNANAEADRAAGYDKIGKGAQPFGYSGSALPKRGEREAFQSFLAERLAAALRVARPGAVMLCWAIPRTSHWTATAIEDAGWVIEDRIAHLFGTGFPKHKSKLKPAVEDWWLARKPGPKWLGVDAGRIGTAEIGKPREPERRADRVNWRIAGSSNGDGASNPAGRWPANLCLSCRCEGLDHDADCPVRMLGEQSVAGGMHGAGKARSGKFGNEYRASSYDLGGPREMGRYGDTGTAARFFYVAKSSRADRGEGNTHPTVKSTELMRWLCRLACPPGGVILDPFMGSGSTGKAAVVEGFGFLGIERDPEYHAIAERRIASAKADCPLFEPVA